MKKILFLLLLWIPILNYSVSAQEDTVKCRLVVQKIEYRECLIKDSLIVKILDEMLLELVEEPSEGVHYPYSKNITFRLEKPSHKIILTSSPNYMYPFDESFQYYYDNGFMYAFKYKGLYFKMMLDLEQDSFQRKMFTQYFKLENNKIEVPYYTFYAENTQCGFTDKLDQTFIYYINKKGRIWGKRFLSEGFWPWKE